MTKALHFSKLVHLLHTVDNLGMPKKLFMRHRSEYEYILSQIQLANHDRAEVSMGTLLQCTELGSQPTVHKRINELEGLNLIRSEKSDDLRLRIFKLTELGEEYLDQCSKTVQSLCEICMASVK